MTTVPLWTDEQVENSPRVKAVFDDIRAVRQTDFVNNFWRALANQPDVLERIWRQIKTVMIEPGELSPLVKELLYVAVSTINGCSYCIHSHTAAAWAQGMTPAIYGELQAVIGLASSTNAIVQALQVPVDPRFDVKG
ncbi:MAG: carboxymuconolactone decarboxylase family protein [Acetobacter sp.]